MLTMHDPVGLENAAKSHPHGLRGRRRAALALAGCLFAAATMAGAAGTGAPGDVAADIFMPAPESIETAALAYFSSTAGTGKFGLNRVPADFQRHLLALLAAADKDDAACTGGVALAGERLSEVNCRQLLAAAPTPPTSLGPRLALAAQAVRGGALNDDLSGAWILEEPALVANAKLGQSGRHGEAILGREGYRAFVAAHELAHTVLRQISASQRLADELPGAFPNVVNDEVFAEAFCDILAIGTLAAVRGGEDGDAGAIARKVAQLRAADAELFAYEAPFLAEVAALVDDYGRRLAAGALRPAAGIDGQIGEAVAFLAASGVFNDFLGGPGSWKAILDDGCADCFDRKPLRRRPE
jgi:hypothetical protein